MLETDASYPDGWASLYDAMDVDRMPHLGFYTGLVTSRTGSLLDLGCGTGSITVAMARHMAPDARVVGVDLSPRMIEIACARAPRHDWRVGDICDPPVEGRFDLVVVCFHTLQMLLDDADLRRCVRAAAARLAPEGRFAFDIYQPNLDWLTAVSPEPHLVRSFRDAQGRSFDVIERDAAYDAATRRLSWSWSLHQAEAADLPPLAPMAQSVRQYFPEDIERALAVAGLRVLERHGDLDRSPFGPDAKRQVYVCGAA